MEEPKRMLRAALATSILITIAIMGSVVIYTLVAVLFVNQGQIFALPGGPGLRAGLLGAALLCAAGGPAFFRMQKATLKDSAGDMPPQVALARLLRARIIGLALAETAAILGLVLTLTTGDVRWSFILGLVSLASMAALWPRRRELEGLAFPGEAPAIEPD